ncbi:hypothetical protein TcasGA2_TC002737 [Tribolium castaneum]|uniref:Uncharacterized protein n=1 Tax=Tribolium castaneum TaxID=7070 RepID=D6WDP4_TRICA|nr:hypothetical protein TcasGA2_TC002737 [Tribolium castaneum]
MSGSNLPKAILSTPSSQDEKSEGPSVSSTLRLTWYHEIIRTNATQSLQDLHQHRVKTLRKELDYLKETEWKYESIDKYIGQ